MRFGPVPLAQALGGILAHSFRRGDLVLRKGDRLGAAQLARLGEFGVTETVVAPGAAGGSGAGGTPGRGGGARGGAGGSGSSRRSPAAPTFLRPMPAFWRLKPPTSMR